MIITQQTNSLDECRYVCLDDNQNLTELMDLLYWLSENCYRVPGLEWVFRRLDRYNQIIITFGFNSLSDCYNDEYHMAFKLKWL